MAEVIIMPKLGFNMDEGELVKWHKKVGDPISKGELFFEINTDKTTMPIEATSDGVVLKILIEEGETVDVFTPVAVVGQAGEDPEEALAKGVATASVDGKVDTSAPAAQAAETETKPAPVSVNAKDLRLTPKAKKLIRDEEYAIETIAQIKGTGYEGGITAKDIKASPLARKIAEVNGVDLSNVQGSGVNGKIMVREKIKSSFNTAVGDMIRPELAAHNHKYAAYKASAEQIENSRGAVEYYFLDYETKPITKANAKSLADFIEEFDIDVVVGIGGGKGMDFARAAAHFVPDVKVVLVPTSASTNASVSQMCVIYNAEGSAIEDFWYMTNPPSLVMQGRESKNTGCVTAKMLVIIGPTK